MKYKLIVAAFAVFVFSSIKAQENVIKVNPLGLIFGSTELAYERVLSEGTALELAVAFTSVEANFSGTDKSKVSGFGAEGKYKFYFSSSSNAPRGWYGAPVVSFSSASGKSGSSEGKVSLFGAGALAGYQWVFGGSDTGFALDLNFGAQYINTKTSGDITGITLNGVVPRIGLSLGYAF